MSEKGVSLKDGARWHLGQAAARPEPLDSIAQALMGIGNALLLSIELQEVANETQKSILLLMEEEDTDVHIIEDEEPKLDDREIEANQARALLFDIGNEMSFVKEPWSLEQLDKKLARYGFDGDQLLGYYQDGLLTKEDIAPVLEVVGAAFKDNERMIEETCGPEFLRALAKACGLEFELETHDCGGAGNPQETLPHTFSIEETMWGSEHPPLETLPPGDPDVQ